MNFFKKNFFRFFTCIDIFSIDLENYIPYPEKDLEAFEFILPDKSYFDRLMILYEGSGGNYFEVLTNRFKDPDRYQCFAFQHKETRKIAYARWMCYREFYSDKLKETLFFNENEALTLNSYTYPEFRKMGLHKEMNSKMLNYIYTHHGINRVYVLINCFMPHLSKVVKNLGYRKKRTRLYYRKGSLKYYSGRLLSKLFSRHHCFGWIN